LAFYRSLLLREAMLAQLKAQLEECKNKLEKGEQRL